MTEEELKAMPLHAQKRTSSGTVITRVVGGWIYATKPAIVFVPDPQAWADAIAFALPRGDPIFEK